MRMSWVNVLSVRRNYKGPGIRVTVGINVATGGSPRLVFSFNKPSVIILDLKPGRADLEVGRDEHDGFVRIKFDRPSGGLRLINSSGHSSCGLRLSSAIWDGVVEESRDRAPCPQAYWDKDTRTLCVALPEHLIGKTLKYRNDLGAVLGLA